MAGANTGIGFLLKISLHGVMFNPARIEGLSFEVGGPNNLSLSLRPQEPDDDPLGHRRGLVFKVHGSFAASQTQREFVTALIARRFLAYPEMPFPLPYIKHGEEQITAQGAMREGFGLPFEAYPPDLQKLCGEAERLLFDTGSRFLNLLIWCLQADAPANVIQHSALYWRVLDGPYHLVGLKRHEATIPSPIGLSWDAQDQNMIEHLWGSDAAQPLGHELLREAKALAASSPRSALLILATSLEVGVKQYISQVAPQTAWLIGNLPSPPVYRLFQKYLPELHASLGKNVSFWTVLSPLFKRCQKLLEDRNDLTHAGTAHFDEETLSSHISTASDLLYLLDVLRGHEWATANVSWEFRKLVGWPDPHHKRTMVSMVTHDL